jgi:dihydroneopterin aldolase
MATRAPYLQYGGSVAARIARDIKDMALASSASRQKSNTPSSDTASTRLYDMFVLDLVVPWRVGVRSHEQNSEQLIRLNINLRVHEPKRLNAEDYGQVVCYEQIVDGVRALAAVGHVKLVETLAKRVADLCLADNRIEEAKVRVEKLDAIRGAASVGIEILRTREDFGVDASLRMVDDWVTQ